MKEILYSEIFTPCKGIALPKSPYLISQQHLRKQHCLSGQGTRSTV